MAVWSISSLSLIRSTNRNDAEFFQPAYKELDDRLNSAAFQRLSHIANITDGIHASPEIAENGIQYISAKCVKDNYFVTDNCIKISQKQNELNIRTQLRENDIIITTVGTIGNVAVVDKEMLPSNCDRHVGIIRIKERVNISPYFISTFLNSKYGYFQSLRESAGNVQLNLYVKNIGNIKIPTFKLSETIVSNLTKEAYELRRMSKIKYLKAQEILEKELGLDKLKFEKPVGYEANFSDVASSLRSDAEYYNPTTNKILKTIKSFEHVTLGSCFNIKNGYPWRSDMFLNDNSGEPVVRIRDIKPTIIESKELTSIVPSHVKSVGFPKANANDVVVGMDGLKYFYASIIESDCYVNQRVAHLQSKLNSKISSEYLTFIINSKIGQAQLLRDMTIATTVGHITNVNILNLTIPYPSKKFHNRITELIKMSIKAKKESQQLLEKARQMVEDLIEEAAGVT